MNHLIQQQYLHVNVTGTESDGLAVQARLAALCQQELLPALEQALNRYGPPEGHLVIGHLEIDVGHLPLNRLEQDFAAAVAQALEKELQRRAHAGAPPPGTGDANLQQRSPQQTLEAALLYFLDTGRLPWSFRLPPGSDLEQLLLDSWLPAAADLASLRRALASATTRERLINQFSTDFLKAFLQRLSPEGRRAMGRILEKLPRATPPAPGLPPATLPLFERQLWMSVLGRLASGASLAEAALVGDAWRCLPAPGRQDGLLAAYLESHWPGSTGAKETTPATPQPSSTGHSPDTSAAADAEAGAGLYLDNAGLVLLHPFLPAFFSHLGLVEAAKLVEPDRALALLHFLATGQPTAPEHALTLPKILCGLSLELSPEKVLVSESDQQEAVTLLEALIRHWETLKNASPDGLRGSFLLRPGKLSRREDGDWRLQVESRSYDLLLNQLPWAISMIKLPWMDHLLWVEWES